MKKEQAIDLLRVLTSVFPRHGLGEDGLRIYVAMLEPVDEAIGRKVITSIVASSRFFPSIAEIRERAVTLERGPVRHGGEAWGDVVREVRRGAEHPQFADPIVAKIVKAWGWRRLAYDGDDVSDRSQFIKLYDAMAKEQREAEVSGVALPKAPPEPAKITSRTRQ